MNASKKVELLAGPRVVGTIHSPGALRHALRLKEGAVDLLEVRVDHFGGDELEKLRKAVPKLEFPLILTVRHPAEGGAGNLTQKQRLALYTEFLPLATLVDVEVRSIESLAGVLAEARSMGVLTIVSDHHFKRTPSSAILAERLRIARRVDADVVKVASRVESADEVARLLALLPGKGTAAVSVMGMGPLGKASRLLFASAGSVLNYGYLDQPQVSGQWSAITLRERLQEVRE